MESAENWEARDYGLKKLLVGKTEFFTFILMSIWITGDCCELQFEKKKTASWQVAAKLARKNEILKDYEASVAKTGGMLNH